MSRIIKSPQQGPLCLETICLRGGQLLNLAAHQNRFNSTRKALWGIEQPILLEESISLPSGLLPHQTFKCRITYGPAIEKIEFELYEVRPIRSLQLVVGDHLDYRFKYADRQSINYLFAHRGIADDILMVRNGLLTDTSYANIALFDGNCWFTPAQPLLEGTQRARLIQEGILLPINISLDDLPRFELVKLINAMLDWEQTASMGVSAIKGLDRR